MKVVGYFEGTDPLLLTKLTSKNIGVMPLGNGADNHGKYIGLITRSDKIGVVVGYAHKVLPVPGLPINPKDILFSCGINKIPVILIAADEDVKNIKERLEEVKKYITVVSPEEVFDTVKKKLK